MGQIPISLFLLFIDIAVIGGHNIRKVLPYWDSHLRNDEYIINDDDYVDERRTTDDVEVISIPNNSISNIKESIPIKRNPSQRQGEHPALGRRSRMPHWLSEEKFQNNCISNIEKSIPSLPMKLRGLRGAQLPSGDLLVGGGWNFDYGRLPLCRDYFLHKDGSDNWENVGRMARGRMHHSSVFTKDCLFTIGGEGNDGEIISQNEAITVGGMAKEVKELPMKISKHTANMLNENQILICGGVAEGDFLGTSRCTDEEEQVK